MTITYPVPNRETLVDYAALTLNGSHNSSTTTLTIDNASGNLPTDQHVRLRIGTELVLCTATSGNDCTVVRGIEGTSTGTYTGGETVEPVLTPTGFETLLLQNSYQGCFSQEGTVTGVPDNVLLDEDGNLLTTSNFTWLNQGTATAVDSSKGGFYLTTQNEAGWEWRGLLLPVPTAPYEVHVKMRFGHGYSIGTNGSTMLAGWYQSGTGEFEGIGIRPGDAAAWWRFDDVNNFNTVIDSANSGYMMDRPVWARLTDNNTNYRLSVSPDGNNWPRIGSAFWEAGRTAFLTATHLCFLVSSNSSGIDDQVFHFDTIVIEEK